MSLDDFDRDLQHIHDKAFARRTKIKIQTMLHKNLFAKTAGFNKAWDSWRASLNRSHEISEGSPQQDGFKPDWRKILLTALVQFANISLTGLCVFTGDIAAALFIFVLLGVGNLMFLWSFK
jgi:hypothetical protein